MKSSLRGQFYTLNHAKIYLMTYKKVKRLFNELQPQHYMLDLNPDRDRMTFSGSVVISAKKIGRPSNRITLHQNDLTITKAYITKHDKTGDQQIKINRINL